LSNRRDVVKALAVGVIGAPAILRGRFKLFENSTAEYSARAIKLVDETVVVDMLNQFQFADFRQDPVKIRLWMQKPGSFTREDFEVYRTSGTRVFSLGSGSASFEAGMRWIAEWNGFFSGYSDWFLRIDDASDFARLAREKNRVGVMLTMQGADHFRTIDDVNSFYALGQRVSQVTYNTTNRLGSGFLADSDIGLTEYGASVIQRMNDVGMAVDLSHSGDKTTLDGLAASKKPTIFSHACARTLIPGHLRCKTDEMIKAMAKTGGVMGIPFIRFMVRGEEPVTIEHALDQFDHVAKLVGVEHVGLGSDMDVRGNPNPMGVPEPTNQPNFDRYRLHRDTDSAITVKQLDHPRRAYDLAEGFIRRKYSDANIRQILGENWQRCMKAIWI
jgi:membrane dipeptidase